MTAPAGESQHSEPPALTALAADRHPAIQSAARWLVANPQLQGGPRGVAWLFEDLAAKLLEAIHSDDPQLTHALGHLTVAKDAAVRAKLADVG